MVAAGLEMVLHFVCYLQQCAVVPYEFGFGSVVGAWVVDKTAGTQFRVFELEVFQQMTQLAAVVPLLVGSRYDTYHLGARSVAEAAASSISVLTLVILQKFSRLVGFGT